MVHKLGEPIPRPRARWLGRFRRRTVLAAATMLVATGLTVPAAAAGASGASTTVISVDPSAQLQPISSDLFGAIIYWASNLEGAYDPQTRELKPAFVTLLKQMGLSQVRWGGGNIAACCYDWKVGIGPVEDRDVNFVREGGEAQPSNFGPDEWGRMLDQIGAKGSGIANYTRGNAQDAANFVAYMVMPVPANPSTDPNDPSYWAAKRAENGHPAPYPVNYWGVGNEIAGSVPWLGFPLVQMGMGKDPADCVTVSVCLYAFGGTTQAPRALAVSKYDQSSNAAVSTGTVGQDFRVDFPPVVHNSQTVWVGGEQWTAVSDLSAAGPNDHVYTFVDSTGEINFGDGTHGAVPTSGLKVEVAYQSGPHDGFVDYYNAIKAVDPDMEICAAYEDESFYQTMGTDYPYDCASDHLGISLAGGYPSNSLRGQEFENQVLYAPVLQGQLIDQMRAKLDQYAGAGTVQPVMDAWGHQQGNTGGDPVNHQRLSEGMLAANQLIEYAKASVPMGQRFLLNDTPYNPDIDDAPAGRRYNAAIVNDPTGSQFFMAPTGYAIQVMSKLGGTTEVASSVAGNPMIQLATGAQNPTLATIASTTDDGKLQLVVVNNSLDTDVTADVDLGGVKHDPRATVETLNGPSWDSLNTFAAPDVVQAVTSTTNVGTGSYVYTFPAHSVTRIEVSMAPTCTRTVSGTYNGPISVNSGVLCLNGATVNGPINVSGASLVATGTTIRGPLSISGADFALLEGTSINGPLAVNGTKVGLVLTHLRVQGPVSVTGNTTTGPALISADTVNGPLACSGNNPPPTSGGQANTVSGPRSGQCAQL